MATLVVSAVRREMKKELSMASFFRKPTVRSVAAILSEQRFSSSDEGISEHQNGLGTLSESMIIANEDNPGPFLFLFPESDGIPSVYSSAFSTLDCKVVAFGDNRWGQPVDMKIDTVENMAIAYITEILNIQPSGQYNLAGWSFGGYLALEVAQQLEERGKEVRIVIMADSNIWNEEQVTASKQRPKWRPAWDHLLTVVNDKNAWLSQFYRVKSMVARYRVSRGKYRGRVVLFKALRGRVIGEFMVREDSHNGWREYLPQVEVKNVDVTHREMFDRENGSLMGVLISQVLVEV